MADPSEGREPDTEPLDILLLEDADPADCDQGRLGHPAQAVNYLLELLAGPDGPDGPAKPVPCPECRRQLQLEPGFYRGNPAVREIRPDGKSLIYMLHPELTKSLAKGLKIQDQHPQ